MKVLLKRLCLMERLDIGDRPSPLCGRRRGFAEHGSAPPQPARAAARAEGGVGGEGTIVAHEFVESLRKHRARSSVGSAGLCGGTDAPLPQPFPREGRGEPIGSSRHFHSHPAGIDADCLLPV